MSKAFNDRGTIFKVNGHEATRTRRAGSPAAKRSARALRSAELRDTVLRMTIERVSQPDIARALNLTQPRISQLLREAWEERQPERAQTIERARQMALMECDLHASPWMKRARTSPRAAEVLLSWLQRSDKIQGLYQQHTSLSLDARSSTPDESADDLTLLDEDELVELERLKLKMQRRLPPPEPPREPVIADWAKAAPTTTPPAQIEDSRVVAVVEDDSLSAQITRLHRQGLSAHAIAQRLNLTLAQLLTALAPESIQPEQGV